MPALDRMLKLLVELVEHQQRWNIYLDTNRVAVVEHCIVQNAAISLLNQAMIQIITLPAKMQHLE